MSLKEQENTPERHLPNWAVVIGFLALLFVGIRLVGQLAQQRYDSRVFYAEFDVRPENKSSEAQEQVSSYLVDLCENMLAAGWLQLELEQNPPVTGLGIKMDAFGVRSAYVRLLVKQRELHDSARQRRTDAWALISAADYPVSDEGCTWDPPGTVLAEEITVEQ